MTIKIVNHHYTECGLPNVWVQCRQAIDDAGKKVIIIPRIGILHKLIAHGIVNSNGSMTGSELKFLRTEMGFTQTELGEIVHREHLTISRWERGQSPMGGAVEALIRILATAELKLDEVDPVTISQKCKPAKPKRQVRIESSGRGHYRLAA